MTSNDAIEQGFIPYPYHFPSISFQEQNTMTKLGNLFPELTTVPVVTTDDLIDQLFNVLGITE